MANWWIHIKLSCVHELEQIFIARYAPFVHIPAETHYKFASIGAQHEIYIKLFNDIVYVFIFTRGHSEFRITSHIMPNMYNCMEYAYPMQFPLNAIYVWVMK